MRTYQSLVVGCVVLCLYSVSGAINQALYKVHQGYEVTSFYEARSAQSLSRCATYCNMSMSCFTATFDTRTKQCQLSDEAVWTADYTDNKDMKTLYLIPDTEVCTNPPPITNGALNVTRTTHGSSAVLTCDKYCRLAPLSPITVNCTLGKGWGNVTGMACYPASTLGSSGRAFVMAFMKNGPIDENGSKGVPTIMVTSQSTSRVRIEIPCIGMDVEYIVSNVLKVSFPISIAMTTSKTIAKNAVFITADNQVQITCLNFESTSSDGSVVFPIPSFGKEYFIAGHPVTIAGKDEFLIGTLNDATLITLKYPSGTTESITLNANDTYFAYDIDLTGTKVSATEPIFLISGHMCAYIYVNYCDYIDEMMPPVSSLGTIHIISFMKPRPDFTISIVATVDSTSVSIFDNTGMPIETIFNLMQTSAVFRSYYGYMTISVISNEPIMVHQYGHGSNELAGDPSMMFIPDVSFFGQQYDFVIPSDFDAPSTLTIVIAASLSASMLEMDGQVLSPTQSVSVTLPGDETYTVLYADVMVGHNNLKHQSAAAFGAWVYGRKPRTEFAWTLGYSV